MLKIPGRAWAPFATVLDLPGTEGLTGIHTEVSPTQDLTRILQSSQVDRIFYEVTFSPAVDALTSMQWADVSDWTEVQINGIRQTLDDRMPPATNQQILINAGLQVGGTVAEYTSAEAFRSTPTAGGGQLLVAEWGAITTGHSCITPVAGGLLPQMLLPNELTIFLRQEVSGANADFTFMFQLLSAPPGVMAVYLGT